jgi:hypothetical protein
VAEIIGDSINYFGDTGIKLVSVASQSTVKDNKVKYNSAYGIYLQSSSPDMAAGSQTYNAFTHNNTGIYCDQGSSPTVKYALIKENLTYGVLSDATTAPNFGTSLSYGNNSFYQSLAPGTYLDLKNTAMSNLMAQGNWWGEYPVNRRQISGAVNYANELDSDPLPYSEKISIAVVDLPGKIALAQNSPNPFNPTTMISFYLAEASNVDLRIYNIQGQLVTTLISGHIESGSHNVIWHGRNSTGLQVSSGVYFYILTTDFGRVAKRMTLLR